MELIIAIPVAIFIVWFMVRNYRQQKEHALAEWINCAQQLLSFHKAPDRTLYERILRLHRTRQLDPQQDRIIRLWLRRALEKNNNFHTGTTEELAITNSSTLFSYLPTVLALYQKGRARASEVTDAINETVAQYGATGEQNYLIELGTAAKSLGGELRLQCITQLNRLAMANPISSA